MIELSRINRVFGDRILVRRLLRPEKMRGLFVPQSYAKEKFKEQHIWFAEIEKFGLDSSYGDAYDLRVGDIVGIHDLGLSNASFTSSDKEEHFWVMEEFLVLKDEGRIESFRNDERWTRTSLGLVPLGAYSVVAPDATEDIRKGVYIPHQSLAETLTGRVLAASKGEVKNGEIVPIRVHVNTDVLFGKYSGLVCNLNNERFLLIKEEDCIAELSADREMAHA